MDQALDHLVACLELQSLGGIDEPPEVRWGTGPMPSVSGRIDGEAAWIEVRPEPFEDEEPHLTLRPDGSLGEN